MRKHNRKHPGKNIHKILSFWCVWCKEKRKIMWLLSLLRKITTIFIFLAFSFLHQSLICPSLLFNCCAFLPAPGPGSYIKFLPEKFEEFEEFAEGVKAHTSVQSMMEPARPNVLDPWWALPLISESWWMISQKKPQKNGMHTLALPESTASTPCKSSWPSPTFFETVTSVIKTAKHKHEKCDKKHAKCNW